MDFGRIWFTIKKKTKRIYKKIRRFFRKMIRWFKWYFRLLVRHTKAKDFSVLIYTILAVLILVLFFVLMGKLFSSIGGNKKKAVKEPTTEISTPADATEDPRVEEERRLADQCRIIYDNNKALMILVNTENPLAEGYTFEHHTLNCGLDVDERAYQNLANMLSDLNAEDLHYDILSAYRSRETQQSIIDNNVQKYVAEGMSEEDALKKTLETVQQVGCSEHETGLALDLVPEGISSLDESLESDPVIQWFYANSYRYGFILRYPVEKASVTGIDYEPWHFRYVGIEAATFLHNNDLTLEEFHALLSK